MVGAQNAFILFLLSVATRQLDAQINCLAKADIVIILDESASVGPANFELIKNFSISIVESFGASISAEWMQVSLMTYGIKPKDVFFLNTTYDPAVLKSNISSLIIQNGTTNTHRALFNTYNLHLSAAMGRRSSLPAIVLLLTDGKSDNVAATLTIANNLKSTPYNATIFAIGIQNASISELNDVSSNPDSKYSHFVNTFADLASITSLIVNETCDAVPNSALVPGNIPPGTNLTQIVQTLTSTTVAPGTPAASSTVAPGTPVGSGGSGLTQNQKIGLGLGIPLALILVGTAAVIGACCFQGLIGPLRKKKEKKKQEEEMNTGDIGEKATENRAKGTVTPTV